jgi:WW domain-binding protein 4
VVSQIFVKCGLCVSLSFSTQFLILLRALHTTCGQQAKKSYEKDLAAIQRADAAGAERLAATTIDTGPKVAQATAERGQVSTEAQRQPSSANEGQKVEWTYDEKTGYHFNAATGYYYDPNSGFYYSDILGKWTTQEEALKASQGAQAEAGVPPAKSSVTKPPAAFALGSQLGGNHIARPPTLSKASPGISGAPKAITKISRGSVGPQKSSVPGKLGRGVASSLEVGKRKREDKSGPVSSEEVAALAAREAAKKRTQEREKALLGLYQAY